MATVLLSPQSRRPALHRGYSCPSPRPPPAQYVAPSTPKWPAYLDHGSWQDAQVSNTFGDHYTNPSYQSSGYGAGAGATMASALGNYNISWPAGSGTFDSYLVAGWNGTSSAGIEAMSPGLTCNSFDLGFPLSHLAEGSQALSYAVTAMAAPALMVSSATVLSEQSILLEDARMNTTVPHLNHNQIASPSPDLQASPLTELPLDRRSVEPDLKSSTNRKAGAVQENRSWSSKITKVKRSAGKVVGSELVWVPNVRESTRTKEGQRRRALNRRHGACPHHKKNHQACNPDWLPYLRCVTSKRPTFYYPIDEIKLFRARPSVGHPLESNRTELFHLQDIQGVMQGSVPIKLTQDLGHELVVYITWYAPRPGDKLSHVWYAGGEKRDIELPPYCLTSLGGVRENVSKYVNVAADRYLEDIIKQSGPITQAMLLQAVQFARSSKSTMVSDALHLLALNRVIERDWRVTGAETLGLPQVGDVDCPWFGKIPVTPMMDTGLDQIFIQDILMPLRRNILSELQEQMQGKRKQDCFEITLTVFIMATNTEWLLRHSRRNALQYNRQHRYSSLALASDYFHGHNVLLSHFHHFAYNSRTSRGKQMDVIVPSSSSLSPDQTSFLGHIQDLVASQMSYARHLRAEKRYEAELHWSHEIFLRGWEPGVVEIVDDVSA